MVQASTASEPQWQSVSPPLTRGKREVHSLFYRLVGALLLLAAGLKIKALLDLPVLADPGHFEHWLGAVQAQFEIILGAALLTAVAPLWSRLLVLCTFSIFAVYSGVQAVRGVESCGCFGDVTIDPLWVFLLDLGILAAALVWFRPLPPTAADRNPAWSRRLSYGLLVVAGGCLVFASTRGWEPMRLGGPVGAGGTGAGQPAATGTGLAPFFAIEPDALLDRRLPFAAQLSGGEALLTGNWVVVFHRPTCAHCELILQKVAAQGLGFFRAPDNARLCLVDMSGAGGADKLYPGLDQLQPPVVESLLSKDYRWIVATPLVVYLADGVVVACADYEELVAD